MNVREVVNVLLDSDDDSDSETSSSSGEDEDFAMQMYMASRGKSMVPIPRIKGYVDEVVSKYDSETFKSHFRMYPETFEFLLSLIGKTLMETPYKPGRKPLDAKHQLLLAIWMMATPDTYRSVCEKFGVGRATALRCVRRVSLALHSIAPKFIQWPKGERAAEVMADYERHSAFPKVIGCIDGTHIKIDAPKFDSDSYINRKGTHSVQVQAVCTRDLLFTSVYAGHVGSVHDARVFRLSPVQNFVEDPNNYFPNDSHLLGDAAYGIHPQIMVPFKDNGHLSRRQRNFNFCLSSARISIERAFGVWKGRWRSLLHCLPMVTTEKIPEYILATAVLHNICIMRRDFFRQDEIPTIRVHQRGPLIASGRDAGISKRESIMNNLIMRNN
ncbi:hypothetical protein ABMA28_011902 [Loxostege sticticalis]|uniref:Putative nuclease HARBI1 n=1 Tax=Loxostege sticticalis TaxID=481309 RepID=A0ABD0TKX2_LOXSC